MLKNVFDVLLDSLMLFLSVLIKGDSEEAAETFIGFFKEVSCVLVRLIFLEGIFVLQTDNNFPGDEFSVRQTDTYFLVCTFISITERYRFFRIYHWTDREFPGRHLPPNRYFRNRFLPEVLQLFFDYNSLSFSTCFAKRK